MKTIVEIGNHSDVGRIRKTNEDYYGSYDGIFGNLLVICDGMGGHTGGQDASRIAVEAVKNHFIRLGHVYNAHTEIYQCIEKANKNILLAVQKNPELKGMGSTIVILLVKDSQVYYAHAGDSRIYMIRENQIHQLTKDHSLVQKLIDSGIIAAENAENYPNKNVIVKALGEKETIEPDIAGPLTVFKGDRFILCTDGLTSYLSNDEILRYSLNLNSQKAAKRLVEFANERGGKDNTTVQVLDVIKGKRLPNKNLMKLKEPKVVVGILGLLIFTLAALLIVNPFSLVHTVSEFAQADSIESLVIAKGHETVIDTSEIGIEPIAALPQSEVKEEPIKKPDVPPALITHIVKKNETISGIALKYGVHTSDLKKWNNLPDNKIKVGQKLRVLKN